jgi:murein DD-endopeptidase MepM/ murein hydrolase activator NlpD
VVRLALLVAFLLSSLGAYPLAQADCGVVDAIDFPLPLDRFGVRYGFGRPSYRFNGRLHTGEDWFARAGRTLGEPVHAIARGRVTLSSPTVWGTDKGMVIVEHIMPDRTVWYSVYGHLEELHGHEFPREGVCVEVGDIVGAIGSPYPSPHLHFEIRNIWPDRTGPGYWAGDPRLDGWANPTQFIVNWQVWLRGVHRWRLPLFREAESAAPALMGSDGRIIYLDGSTLFAVSASGKYVWFDTIEGARPLGLVRTGPETFALALADGTVQDWSDDGWVMRTWSAGRPLDGPPITFGDLTVVHSPDLGLMAYDADRTLRWQIEDVDRVVSSASTGDALAVTDRDGGFWLIDRSGRVIDRASLGHPGNLVRASRGSVYVRTEHGLWQVFQDGRWRWLSDAPHVDPTESRMIADARWGFYLWTGGRSGGELIAYDTEGEVRWRQSVPARLGTVHMVLDGECRLLVGGGRGYLYAFNRADGTLLSDLRLYSDANSAIFVGLADDGQARFLVYDQLAAFDLEALTGVCR